MLRLSTLLIIGALATSSALFEATPAVAAPAKPTQGCGVNAFLQLDMAGYYEGTSDVVKVYIDPCGPVVLGWQSPNGGGHVAGYFSYDRLVGNGIAAFAVIPCREHGVYPDGAATLALKAAEPGYITMAMKDANGAITQLHRLRKVSNDNRLSSTI